MSRRGRLSRELARRWVLCSGRRRQERRGLVVSSAMDKTIVVKVDVIKSHPRYNKVVRRSVKLEAIIPHATPWDVAYERFLAISQVPAK